VRVGGIRLPGTTMHIGFCNGCFDFLHEGHRHFLREAARQCDYLVVAVNDDAWCRLHKGPDRPRQPLETRMEAVSTFLMFIPGHNRYDFATIPFAGDSYDMIGAMWPDVVFRGHDQRKECPSHIKVVSIDKVGDFSTTSALQRSKL
jgi:D-beta-D-heptose 7-phosphate kinase / D-beta-D-heptose 1-phosphate adenosyltransferase